MNDEAAAPVALTYYSSPDQITGSYMHELNRPNHSTKNTCG